MPLKLNLIISNKAVHAFIALIVLTVIASGVYAYIVSPGTVPNPGHALSTIQGYFQGDASLLQSLAKLQQQVTGQCAAGSSIRVINADGTVSCETDDTGPAGLGGSGTANYLAKWNAATTLANSVLYENSGNIGIGTTSPGAKLEVAGQVKITGGTPGAGKVLTSDASGLASWQMGGGGGGITSLSAGNGIILSPNPITSTGTISADTAYLQRRVSASCPVGSSIRAISSTGTVTCETTVVSTSAICVTRVDCAPGCEGTLVYHISGYGTCTATSDTGSCNASGCLSCFPSYEASCCVCSPV